MKLALNKTAKHFLSVFPPTVTTPTQQCLYFH